MPRATGTRTVASTSWRCAPRSDRVTGLLQRAARCAALFSWVTLALAGSAWAAAPDADTPAHAEVRGTWLTTTANDALASPERTAATMQRLREIGLNTVYVEAWKNGYTQFPSRVLERTLGVAQRPANSLSDPSDALGPRPARDLLQETLIEAHRQG